VVVLTSRPRARTRFEAEVLTGEAETITNEDDDDVGIEGMATQAVETLRLLAGSRFGPLLKAMLQPIAAIAISYMQVRGHWLGGDLAADASTDACRTGGLVC
jgi:hypothetical protein